MIPANELRIGNWVKHNSDYSFRNEELKEFYFQWEDRDWYAMGECLMSLDIIEPILLTPSILEKCGFKTRGEGYSTPILEIAYQDGDYPCSLQRTGDGIQVARSGIGAITAHIEYLHQLQNLFFALTQTELNITL